MAVVAPAAATVVRRDKVREHGRTQDFRMRDLLPYLRPLDRRKPAAAVRIHANDQRRTIRALEVFRLTGTPITQLQTQWDQTDHGRRDCVLVGLDWPTDAINRRINELFGRKTGGSGDIGGHGIGNEVKCRYRL